MIKPGTMLGIHPLLGIMVAVLLVTAGCAAQQEQKKGLEPSRNHLLRATNPPAQSAADSTPMDTTDPNEALGGSEAGLMGSGEVFTVTVTETPVKDILFALAKDANMNIDIYPGITGRITLSAINQTMPQILDRIARQVRLRYEVRDNTIIISPDQAYLKVYQVDYINMSRKSNANIKVSTQLSTDEKSGDNPLTGGGDKNQSDTNMSSSTHNQFWQTLTSNISSILGKDGGGAIPVPSQSSGNRSLDMGADPFAPVELPQNTPGAIVAVNPEAGIISIMATSHQHQLVKQFLDKVLANVHRQVLIESTVVEVELSDRAQEGVDWNQVYDTGARLGVQGGQGTGSTLAGAAAPIGTSAMFATNAMKLLPERAAGSLPFFNLNVLWPHAQGLVDFTIKMLQRFGNVKVLSSPKIMALNSQPAILKVVENKIFFTLEATGAVTSLQGNGTPITTPLINSKVHSVPVGLVMTVTPQISDEDIVTMNVRPTISNISGWVDDPNPHLTNEQGVRTINKIPEIRVREMETMLRVHSGQVAVLGGLMQDKINKYESSAPVLGDIPVLGKLFGFTDNEITKTELVVFLRPVVMTQGRPRETRVANTGPRLTNRHIPSATAGGLDFTKFSQGQVPNPNVQYPPGQAPSMPAPSVQGSTLPPPNQAGAPVLDGDTATLRTSSENDFTRPMTVDQVQRRDPVPPRAPNPTRSADRGVSVTAPKDMSPEEDVVTLGTSGRP